MKRLIDNVNTQHIFGSDGMGNEPRGSPVRVRCRVSDRLGRACTDWRRWLKRL